MREKNFLSRSLMVQSLSSVLPQVVPLFASAFTFIAMTMTGVDLTATQVCSHLKMSPGLPPPIATASSCHISVCKVLWMSCASLRLPYAMFYFFQSYVGLMSLKYWYDWNDWISIGINQGLSQFYTSEIGVEGMLSFEMWVLSKMRLYLCTYFSSHL